MSKNKPSSRRKFIKNITAGSLVAGVTPSLIAGSKNKIELIKPDPSFYEMPERTANDKIRLGVVGVGIIGFYNIEAALNIQGMELVAACDLYEPRLQKVKQRWGSHIYTTRDYKELINRNDVDAVLVATSDNWHDTITIDALNAGKAVYCEKPMVHKIEQGAAVIQTAEKTKKVLQIGSNPMSDILVNKAKELYAQGAIGQLILVNAVSDRHSSLGAWNYSMPNTINEKDLDWDTFQKDSPKKPFDPKRFFRWRNYQDYGTSMAGDLFVHLYTQLHHIISSKGPERIFASGGLRYWKDGRDVPDLMVSIADYPETETHAAFQFNVRSNFVAGGEQESGLTLVGSEGSMKLTGRRLILNKTPLPDAPGYGGYDSLFTFPKEMEEEFIEAYKAKYYSAKRSVISEPVEYRTPEGYSNRLDHWVNFVKGIREGAKIAQDGTYGLRAAAPSLAANLSYFGKKIVQWDPVKLKLKG